MEYKKDEIRDLFSSKLKNFEVDPPESLWDEIDSQLSKKHHISKSYQLSKILIPVFAVAASIALLIFMLPNGDIENTEQLSLVHTQNEVDSVPNKRNDATKIVTSETEKGEIIKTDAQNTQVSSTKIKKVLSAKQVEEKTFAKAEISTVYKPEEITPSEENGLIDSQTNLENSPIEKEEDEFDNIETVLVGKNRNYDELDILNRNQKGSKEKRKTGAGFSLSANTTYSPMNSEARGTGGDLLFSRDDRTEDFIKAFEHYDSEVELEHRQPVSVGLLFSKNINSKISLETGLMYTRLSSRAKSSEGVKIRESQKFDYLGVPLNVNYNIYRLGDLQLYATAGVMFQKDINGSYTSQAAVIDGYNEDIMQNEGDIRRTTILETVINESETIKKSIRQSNIQVSTHGLVGVSYPLYKMLNIYATVGVAHYFKAGNKHATIYSDRRTHMDINTGFRVSF